VKGYGILREPAKGGINEQHKRIASEMPMKLMGGREPGSTGKLGETHGRGMPMRGKC
jgi:hypothetical protein